MVYRLTIEYDGSGWHGWQVQAGVPTIQEALEAALATALRTRVPVTGSGRTDAGVHATGQVAHFETTGPVDPDRLMGNLNGLLPRSIAVRDIAGAHPDFHARYSAVLRSYRYRISTLPIALSRTSRVFVRPAPDIARMNQAAADLITRDDYSSFCRTSSETTNRVCAVSRAGWESAAEPGAFDFVVSADRFLHGMVRALVGTLLEIGAGKRPVDDVPRVLAARDRRVAGPAAPAYGLSLETVHYPPELLAPTSEATSADAGNAD
ncbi:MAG: tRNA pseudouridine(38-40) synthase TruA [Rhodothermales bacterium]|nr:tRNA pseudouridine(38-40) synthase TruA [Rhodothermales bacterium]MBO6779656.1 tRNA pseudouridine(38-40) synthase TruA [Rhodothermales bacterium]